MDETVLYISIGITIFWVICLVIYPFVVKWIKSNIKENKQYKVEQLQKKDIIIKATFIPFISLMNGFIMIMMSATINETHERLGLTLFGFGFALTMYAIISFTRNNSKLWKRLKEGENDKAQEETSSHQK